MRIDLNADLGEGFGRWTLGPDEELLDLITSANVACGFHAGDPSILRRVCEGAAERGVRVGAQVSYNDLAGFGRRAMDVPFLQLRDEVLYQIAALDGMCRVSGIAVSYVKPHGALYNRCFGDASQAAAVAAAAFDYNPSLAVLGQPDSALLAASEAAGLAIAHEAFADRAYAADGALVPRAIDGSVLHDPDLVVARVVRMVAQKSVVAHDDTVVDIEPRSICLHSDTPGAVELATRVRSALVDAGLELVAFT